MRNKKIYKTMFKFIKVNLISLIALIFSCQAIKLSNEANKITKGTLEFNIGTQRARLYIDFISPPKIKIEEYGDSFKVECYLTVKNIGKTPATGVSSKISIKPEFLNAPQFNEDMGNFSAPVFIKADEIFWLTVSFEVVGKDLVHREQLIREIEDGKVNMLLDATVKYSDAVTSKKYVTSALMRFNKKSVTLLKANSYIQPVSATHELNTSDGV